MDLRFASHPFVRTTNVDEAVHLFTKTYRALSLDVPRSRRSFAWSANAVSSGPMFIASGWLGADVRLTCEPGGESLIFSLSRGGEGCLRVGRELYSVGQAAGALISPTMSASYTLPGGFLPLTVALNWQALSADLQALTGVHLGSPLEFDCRFDGAMRHGADIRRLLDFIVQTVDAEPTILSSPPVMANLRNAFMMSLLLGQPHSHRRLLERQPPSPSKGSVRVVEAYLEAKAAEPISMTDLAEVAGVSVRAIQAGFRDQRGCSPMAFLKERRLELARKRLSSASPGTTVTDVAHECGFSHLGRFSQEYSKRFGESPSDTRRAAVGEVPRIRQRR